MPRAGARVSEFNRLRHQAAIPVERGVATRVARGCSCSIPFGRSCLVATRDCLSAATVYEVSAIPSGRKIRS
jgi:hypothetical protein